MARMKVAARANMKGWEPAPMTPPVSAPRPTYPNPRDLPGRDPNMLASMPLGASTGDAFQRQFYGGANLPTQRILPAGGGGTA
jgi:hypothetical protein